MVSEKKLHRVDQLLVEQGVANSRARAQRWISEGKVSYKLQGAWRQVSKPGVRLPKDIELAVQQDEADNYVSRGALKLKAAVESLQLDVAGMTAIDVGASTGGFSDYLLQQGATSVVCVDVGHGQLAEKLRLDPRVSNYEGVNARNLSKDLLIHTRGQGFDIAVMDVSFISQTLIIPSLAGLLKNNACLISLVKPQFEVGPEGVGKGGIVKDARLYSQVKEKVTTAYLENKFTVINYLNSPIKGSDGNTEFLLCARKDQ